MQWLFVNDKSRKRGLSLIWQTVILFLLALATGLAWISYREYRQTLDNEYRYLESHAQFGEVEISEAVHRIDRLLQRIGDGRALMGTLPQALIRDRERKQLEQLPEIHFLISADRKGRVVTAESMDNPDDVPRVAALDVSQREYFTALRDAPARDADHVFVSSMFRTVTGRETIAISRALRDEAGNFQGILVASISPDYFLHVLARALPKADAPGLVLVDENGRIVHRLPTPPGPMPDSVAESPNYKAFKASGQHELGMLARSAIDNIERVIVYSRIGDTTLSLAVSRSTEATFAEWRRAVLLRSVTYLLIMGITIGLAIEAKRRQRSLQNLLVAEEHIQSLAFFDQLTGLPNRALLLDRLAQAQALTARTGNTGALLLIDLDNFKVLNDTRGLDAGDQLLKQAAGRIRGCLREIDSVARLGGDEFVVLLAPHCEGGDEAAAATRIVEDKLLRELSRPYAIGPDEGLFRSSASIGVTLYSGQAVGVDELLKQADIAMYRAKAMGRGMACFFDAAMEASIRERTELEHALRHAIDAEQLVLYYQSQVDEAGAVVGAEALVRWPRPGQGMVSPASFIPLAEETGLIIPLGQYVLRSACATLARWARMQDMADLSVAVNVSIKQVQQPDFVDQVQEVVVSTGANPHRLKLELTEGLFAADADDIIGKMQRLKAMGVSISLDDFGTGYSSLAYLKRMPLDQLKIDQSFVRDVLTDPNDAAIVQTVIALSRSLGLSVIAEGVETQAQMEFLARHGCRAYQGYFFSRPVPIEELERSLRAPEPSMS